ncbi:MAG TPA: hypothetical protein VJ826_02550 [Candidatus Polarisedimenticolaceae bacterium]|nr:hypothetical protein [Candidatus Polarisedimenticolaceae bacterium]
MNERRTLIATSLLSILLFSWHWADEVARAKEPGTISAVGGLVILFVWLYATLALSERRLGLWTLLIGGILGSGVPVLHMQGKGLLGGAPADSPVGTFFWVWTLIVLAPISMVSLVLSARGLWAYRRGARR